MDKYYLVDSGYSTKKDSISPYHTTRYKLKEPNSLQPSSYREFFHLQHSSLRTTMECILGSLKSHFDGGFDLKESLT